jgi:hypothetical protein
VSGSGAIETWGLGEVVDQRPSLLTGHHYPLGCEEQPPPTTPRLLSRRVQRRELSSLRRYASVARSGEAPFRLDETNTVSCGGVAGISNTFASALWAVGYLTQAMSVGLSGVNLQGNPANCQGYTPLCAPTPQALAAGALSPQPEWYALLLLKALSGDRPLPTSTRSHGRPNIQVTALLAANGSLHFVIVDDDPPGARRVSVRLPVGVGFSPASVLSLTAPAPSATAGVRLGGRAVSADGSWSAPATLPRAPDRRGVVTFTMRPASAALLSASPEH